jgi:hypothetical protein
MMGTEQPELTDSAASNSGAAEKQPLSPVQSEQGLRGWNFIFAALATVAYISFVAWVAGRTGLFYIMFPELGALAYDVFSRPAGNWCNEPAHLATTPALTGVIGIAITRSLPYGPLAVTLDVGCSLAVIMMLGSPIAPAISAGLLPLALGVTSWLYPPAILFGTALLAALTFPWRRLFVVGLDAGRARRERWWERHWLAANWPQFAATILLAIVAALAVIATGQRMILFPPLVVIAFETFRHRFDQPWAGRLNRVPLACLLTAAGGLLCVRTLGVSPPAAALSVMWSIAVLRTLRLHVPPALAVGLLPMVMGAPNLLYPVAVAIGTLLLLGSFALFRLVFPLPRASQPLVEE